MKRYTLTPAQAFNHVPQRPELTAVKQGKSIGTGDSFRVFASADALHLFLLGPAGDWNEWRAWLDTPAGHRWQTKGGAQ
jgi:hypothetical protein